MRSFKFEFNKSDFNDINAHLLRCDNLFSPNLSSYVNIEEYALKLYDHARRIEIWKDDILCGLLAFYTNREKQSVYITNLSLEKNLLGLGLGGVLIDNCYKELSIINNSNSFELKVHKKNEQALNFYKKHRFKIKSYSDDFVELERSIEQLPKVSICCTTYNHELFLRDCLEGFLLQKTDFTFEILIHDDASTDHTAKIIKEYQDKFPNLIKPIFQKVNQYSQGLKCNVTFNLPRAQGEFIAFCEGDDYWTDPLKLQKQVDFLESNLGYNYCGHKSSSLMNGKIKEIEISTNELTFSNLIFKNVLNTATLTFRASSIKELPEFTKVPAGDWALQLISINNSKAFILSDNMSVYRVHERGVWGLLDRKEQCERGVKTQEFFKNIYSDKESIKLINKAIKSRRKATRIHEPNLFHKITRLIKRIYK